MTAFRLALLHLIRKRLTTVIALIALAVSVAAGGVLVRLYLLSQSRFASLALQGDAVIGAKAGGIDILLGALNLEGPYPDYITSNLYQTLKQHRGLGFSDKGESHPDYVMAIVPMLYFARYHDYRVIGTESSYLTRPVTTDQPSLASGRFFTGPNEIVLGTEIARQEGRKVGDIISLNLWTPLDKHGLSSSTTIPMTVVGLFAPTGTAFDIAAFSSLTQAQELLQSSGGAHTVWGANILNYCIVYLRSGSLPDLNSLINQRSVAQVISVPEQYERLRQLAGTGQTMGLIIISLILLLGGLGVISTMIARFDALSYQVAVLRAIGYSRSFIGQWLLWEGMLLGLSACLVGGLVDLIAFPAIRAMFGDALPTSPLVHAPIYLSAPVWLVAIAATVIGIIVPFVRFNRHDPHSLLKGF
jgi:putative ABC transport system permease protein